MQWSYFINSSKDNSIEYATKFAWENRISVFLTRVLPAGDKRVEPLQSASIFKIVPGEFVVGKHEACGRRECCYASIA